MPGTAAWHTATARCIRATQRRALPALYELADKHGVNFEGALTWAFEFENEPYFAGFRVLASNGIDLPVLNVFRMFGKMGGTRLAVTSSAEPWPRSDAHTGVRGAPDVSALASITEQTVLCAGLALSRR